MPLEFRQGSATLDFAKTAGGAAATETFERYLASALPAGNTYIPADEGIFSATMGTTWLHVDLRSGGTWYSALGIIRGNSSVVGEGASLRFRNSDTIFVEFLIFRHLMSTGTYEENQDVDLAGGAAYTPADGGFFSHTSEAMDVDCEHFNFLWFSQWDYDSNGANDGVLLTIGDGTNLRYRNISGSARRLIVMRAVMVT